jgi:hypothetical protein
VQGNSWEGARQSAMTITYAGESRMLCSTTVTIKRTRSFNAFVVADLAGFVKFDNVAAIPREHS